MVCFVRDAPGLYRGVSPLPPHESLKSSSSHEIARKIQRAKRLDTKIRETKGLGADGGILIQLSRPVPSLLESNPQSRLRVTREAVEKVGNRCVLHRVGLLSVCANLSAMQ